MDRRNDTASEHYALALQLGTAPVRTYRQIADLLAEREGTPISLECVKEACRTAERKLARALRTEPDRAP